MSDPATVAPARPPVGAAGCSAPPPGPEVGGATLGSWWSTFWDWLKRAVAITDGFVGPVVGVLLIGHAFA